MIFNGISRYFEANFELLLLYYFFAGIFVCAFLYAFSNCGFGEDIAQRLMIGHLDHKHTDITEYCDIFQPVWKYLA